MTPECEIVLVKSFSPSLCRSLCRAFPCHSLLDHQKLEFHVSPQTNFFLFTYCWAISDNILKLRHKFRHGKTILMTIYETITAHF